MLRNTRSSSIVIIGLSLGFGLASCGGSDDDGGGSQLPATAPSPTATPTSAPAAATPSPTAQPTSSPGPTILPLPTGSPRPTASPGAQVTVNIAPGASTRMSDAFGPSPLVITQGTTVTWVNNDSLPHTSTSTTGLWDSEILGTGQSFSYTFNQPGDFEYFCEVHPMMRGVVRVQ
jgi:plastocyanin